MIHNIKTHIVCRIWSKNLSETILATSFNPGSTACSSWSESIAGSSVLVRGIEKASLKDGVDGDRFEFGDLVQVEKIERVRPHESWKSKRKRREAKQACFSQFLPVSCFVSMVASKRELMAFADTRYDIQLAVLIHNAG